MHNEVRDALCGTGLQIQGNIFIWDNYIGHNGSDGSSGRPGTPWSDGLTALWCNGHIIENTFVDNTDIQLALGGGPCLAVRNTIASFGKFGFAGLNPGTFENNFGPAGNHTGAKIYDKNVYTGPGIVDKLFMGILVGAHPWNVEANVSNTGSVYANSSRDNVMNIVVEGVFGGRVGFDELGASKPNPSSGNRRESAAFHECALTKDYTVHTHPEHVNNTLLQVGHTFLKFDNGQCTDVP